MCSELLSCTQPRCFLFTWLLSWTLWAGSHHHPILQKTTLRLWEVESLVQAHGVSVWWRSGLTSVLKPLTMRLYGLVLEFGWETCKIFSSRTEFCEGGQHRGILGRWLGRWQVAGERVVGEGAPRGTWKGPAGPAGSPHCHHCSWTTQCLRTTPPHTHKHSIIAWSGLVSRVEVGTFIFH